KLKRWQRLACGVDRPQCGIRLEIHAKAQSVEHLGDQATIRERGTVTVAVTSVKRRARQLCLERFESQCNPMSYPAVLVVLRQFQLARQKLEDAQIVERVYFTRDRKGKLPHMGPMLQHLRQQWEIRIP